MLQTALELAQGKVSSRSLLAAVINYAEKSLDNSVKQSHSTAALRQAELFDTQKSKEHNNIMSGLPVSVKDNFNAVGYQATAGSKILESYESPYDAEIVTRIKSQGAIVCAKANMDEFGMGSSMLNSAFGATVSPWTQPGSSLPLSPGGSSGGNAVLVSRGVVAVAIGSDTGGSVRQPASFCGIVGLKPTYGAISRHGLISYSSSMDTVGILSQNVIDAAVMCDALRGFDEKDPSSSIKRSASALPGIAASLLQLPIDIAKPIHPDDIARMIAASVNRQCLPNLKVGVPLEFILSETDGKIRDCWQTAIWALQDAGASVKTVSIPSFKLALPCYYVLACAEASSNLARYDGLRFGRDQHPNSASSNSDESSIFSSKATKGNGDVKHSTTDLLAMIADYRGSHFGPEVIKRVLAGSFVLTKGAHDNYYGKAREVRAQLQQEVQHTFNDVDVLLFPTSPELPFALSNPPTGPSMLLHDAFTVPVNLVGCPAVSIPVGVGYSSHDKDCTQPLPIGMQLMARHHNEVDVLKAGLAIEQRVEFSKHVPDYVRWRA